MHRIYGQRKEKRQQKLVQDPNEPRKSGKPFMRQISPEAIVFFLNYLKCARPTSEVRNPTSLNRESNLIPIGRHFKNNITG